METLFALILAFIAGFIDALAGGGGLIQIPGLMLIFPQATPTTILAANKLSSWSGTLVAILSLRRKIKLSRTVIIWAAIASFISAFIGAYLATLISAQSFRLVASILLITAIVVSYLASPATKNTSTKAISENHRRYYSLGIGILGGLYDGFFGPGLGTILILLFVTYLSMNFLEASLHAKVLNLLSNGGALIYFISHGLMPWQLALPMAAMNIGGSLIGSRMALLRGNRLVKRAVGIMSLAIIAKIASEWIL